MKNKKTFGAAAGKPGEKPRHKRGKPEFKARPKAGAAKEAGPAKASEDRAAAVENGNEGERIAKRLARAGVASRRDAEAMVAAGRIKVNGRVLATPAFKVRPSDRIELDGAPIPEAERTRLFLLHKPAGIVTTSRDPEGRRTVFDILPPGLPRLITIGRLDINTEGLLLLTNDGGLARVLELPSTGWLRRYRVRVHGHVDPLALAELEKGTAVDGVFYGAIEATLDRKQGSNAWLTLGLREGKNREVKNVLGALGLDVTRLIRVSYGPFQLGALPEGAVQEIKGRMLRDQLGQRLIEEAGANFEAPIAQPFSNKPVRVERNAKPAAAAAKAPRQPAERQEQREARRPPVNRKREREDHREEMRDRLQTKPPVRGKDARPAGKDARAEGQGGRTAAVGKEGRSLERRSRASNVWMAPGARPVGRKRAEEAAAATERRGRTDKPAGGMKRGGPEGDRKPAARRPSRGKPPGKGR